MSDTLAAVLKSDTDWDTLPSQTPPSIRRLLRRCLQRDRKRRLPDIAVAQLEIEDTRTQEEAPLRPALRKPKYFWWLAAAGVLGIAAVGWTVWRFRESPTQYRPLRVEIDPPTGGRFIPEGAVVGGLALSPDGYSAAYVAMVNGKSALWVRSLDGTGAHLLSGTEEASHPFWSTDGKSIGFTAHDKLQRLELTGGPPVVICDNRTEGTSWGDDGYILFGTPSSGLYRVSASGGTPSPVTTLDTANAEFAHRWPQLLPGGRFLYWTGSSKSQGSGVYAASLAKPAERVRLLTTDTAAIYANGFMLWLRGGMLVAQKFDPQALKFTAEPHHIGASLRGSPLLGALEAAASANGSLLLHAFEASAQFHWVDRTGKSLGVIGEPGDYSPAFRLSPDGRLIVAPLNSGGVSQLWLLESGRGLASRFSPAASSNTAPIWSPDGRVILYGRVSSGQLIRKDANGVSTEQSLIERTNLAYPCDWSRDGRWVLFHEFITGSKWDLWMLPVTAAGTLQEGASPKLYLRTPANEQYARFSPEPSPHWVAYESDESGRYEVYVDAFPEPRGRKQISTTGGRFSRWGPAGRELFYIAPDYKLMSVNIKFSPDSMEPSTPRELFTMPATSPGFEVSSDGERFLLLKPQERGPEPLTLIVNWPALLKEQPTAP